MNDAVNEVYGLGERAVARRSDPDTSHDAAASVTRISEMQALIVQVLEICGPLSDTALRGHVIDHTDVRISDSGLRTRRRELVEMGKVRDSGQRVTLPTGRQSIVWCLA